MRRHLDDVTLLRLVASDLPRREATAATAHVEDCPSCGATLSELRELDRHLRGAAAAGTFGVDEMAGEFAPGDPFRRRPRLSVPVASGHDRSRSLESVSSAAAAIPGQQALLDGLKDPGLLTERLERLALDSEADRFALLYALQEAGRRIAEGPLDAERFAAGTLSRLRREGRERQAGSAADRSVPWHALWAQAQSLAAQAKLWTRDYARGRSHAILAYRAFARAGDETGLAHVELHESQRRSFAGEADSALALASRAHATFAARGMEDMAARARVGEGLAFAMLDRHEESLKACREALPVFARLELWSNYVGALNSMGTSLMTLGRLDEARREYARALREFSAEQHRSWLAFLKHGLAGVLLSAGRYREAAQSAAQAVLYFERSGLKASALICALLEIEGWARHGSLGRARQRLERLGREIASIPTLDPGVLREIRDALFGTDPEFKSLAALRGQIQQALLNPASTARR
ncbi:MAG: hypothetical protein WAU32_03025 [Thermoanaerobaculia bacterium]